MRTAAQDGVGNRLRRIPARGLVAVELLDPLQIDDGRNADQQIDVLRHVDFIGHHGTVQALIEEQVRAAGYLFPLGEGARLLAMARRLHIVVQVIAHLSAAALGIPTKKLPQLRK